MREESIREKSVSTPKTNCNRNPTQTSCAYRPAKHLTTARRKKFADFLFVLVHRGYIRLVAVARPRKIAKFAMRGANVGEVDISVDNPTYLFAILGGAQFVFDFIGNIRKLGERRVAVEILALVNSQRLQIKSLVIDGV